MWLLFRAVLSLSSSLAVRRVQAGTRWRVEGHANSYSSFCSCFISDLCYAEPGIFRQVSLLCQILFQTGNCPKKRLAFLAKGNYTGDQGSLFTIFQGTMGADLQLCSSPLLRRTTTSLRKPLLHSPVRFPPAKVRGYTPRYPPETQTHLVKQQHFVFIRSSHGNITQSS